MERTLLAIQLVVGSLTLFIQGNNFERQSAVKTEFEAFPRGEGSSLVESGISEECLSA